MMILALVYVMWRPVSQGAVLYPVLGLGALGAVSVSARRGLAAPLYLLTGAWLLTLVVLGSALVGSLNGTPGLSHQLTQWLGSIVVWSAVASCFTVDLARRVVLVVCLTMTGCAAVIVWFILSQRVGVPFPAALAAAQEGGYGVDELGEGVVRWYGLSSLTAAAPFLVAAWIAGPDRILPGRRLSGVASVATVLAALIAGRRAIVVVTLLAPVLYYVLRPRTGRRVPRPVSLWLPAVAATVVTGTLIAWDSTVLRNSRRAMADALATYTGVGSDVPRRPDDEIRVQQARELLAAWGDSPIVGRGLGSRLEGFSRSQDRPWMFELQYHQLLMNTGLVGAVLCLVAGWRLYGQYRFVAAAAVADAGALTASMVGAVALLVANASNPYLQAVGHGWGIALGVGVLTAVGRTIEDRRPDAAGASPLVPAPDS